MPDLKDKPTIYDVAREAGVAISTVSRVLNASGEVSETTRRRVQEAIEVLQFHPQRTARSLAQQQTHSLAVAMPSFTSLFYVEILKGVKDELRQHDIDLLLCNLGSIAPRQTLYRFLARGAVDALIVAALPMTDELQRTLASLRAPVILLGMEAAGLDSISWDNARGTEAGVAHLAGLGHARIGMITAHPWSYTYSERVEGYRRALDAAGLRFDPALVMAGETQKHAGFSEEAGYEAMQKLLRLETPPTAVFVTSDVKAFGAWSALRDAGMRVPEDVALVGYDNLKLSRFLGLSSVDQQMYDVGQQATQRLLERMDGIIEERLQRRVTPELVIRGSSGPSRHPA